MAKSKTVVHFDILEELGQLNDGRMQDDVGRVVIDKAKNRISRGLSPVKGEPAFEKYANPEKYPGKRKAKSPVNLNLSGKMLKDFGFRRGENGSTEFTMIGGEETEKRAGYHNDGTDKMAKRRFIPDDGQTFTDDIMKEAVKTQEKHVQDLIRQTNKKK